MQTKTGRMFRGMWLGVACLGLPPLAVSCSNQKTSEPAKAYNNRGISYEDKGDHDKAIADFTEAIRLDPNDAKPTTTGPLLHQEGRIR